MIALLLTPFGRLIGYVMGIFLICGIIFGWYEIKISEAKKEALASFNQQQLQEVVKEQQDLIGKMEILQNQEKAIEDATSQLNDAVKDAGNKANEAVLASKDKNFDPLFNSVLKNLRGRK